MFTNCSFESTKNKLDGYRDKGCMERFCKDLNEQATRITNYEKKKRGYHWLMKKISLTKREFSTDDDNKKYHKVWDHCHYTGKFREAAHNICNLRYKTPNEISIVFHNGFTYDYHFIIKQ